MSERDHAHQLIDRLPDVQLSALVGLLETMVDPASSAAVDDEPVTEEDRRRLREGQARLAQRGGKGTPMQEVLAEFGLKPEDFPLHK